MSNYKLTPNLIADCMALIPHNLEVLNAKFSKYDFIYLSKKIIWRHDIDTICFVYQNFKIQYCPKHEKFQKDSHDFNYPNINLAVIDFITHCLRTIQEFHKIQPLYYYYHNQRKNAIEKLEKEGLSYHEIKEKLYMPGAKDMLTETWKTIASATLHGQGEYPPSTLEELCESYKNVMKKPLPLQPYTE